MKNLRGFSTAAAVLVIVIAGLIVIGGVYLMQQRRTSDSTIPAPVAEETQNSAPSPAETKTAEVTPIQKYRFVLLLDDPTHPVLMILPAEGVQTVQTALTGWRLESAAAHASFVIPAVTENDGYKGSVPEAIPPKDVLFFAGDQDSLSFYTGTGTDFMHGAEGGIDYGVYLETDSGFLTAPHDIITLRDTAGVIQAQYSY